MSSSLNLSEVFPPYPGRRGDEEEKILDHFRPLMLEVLHVPLSVVHSAEGAKCGLCEKEIASPVPQPTLSPADSASESVVVTGSVCMAAQLYGGEQVHAVHRECALRTLLDLVTRGRLRLSRRGLTEHFALDHKQQWVLKDTTSCRTCCSYGIETEEKMNRVLEDLRMQGFSEFPDSPQQVLRCLRPGGPSGTVILQPHFYEECRSEVLRHGTPGTFVDFDGYRAMGLYYVAQRGEGKELVYLPDDGSDTGRGCAPFELVQLRGLVHTCRYGVSYSVLEPGQGTASITGIRDVSEIAGECVWKSFRVESASNVPEYAPGVLLSSDRHAVSTRERGIDNQGYLRCVLLSEEAVAKYGFRALRQLAANVGVPIAAAVPGCMKTCSNVRVYTGNETYDVHEWVAPRGYRAREERYEEAAERIVEAARRNGSPDVSRIMKEEMSTLVEEVGEDSQYRCVECGVIIPDSGAVQMVRSLRWDCRTSPRNESNDSEPDADYCELDADDC